MLFDDSHNHNTKVDDSHKCSDTLYDAYNQGHVMSLIDMSCGIMCHVCVFQ
jgi:hypothetical protein